MTQPKPPHIGPPLQLTPEALDHAAEVTGYDIALAAALWAQNAPLALSDLLHATEEGVSNGRQTI